MVILERGTNCRGKSLEWCWWDGMDSTGGGIAPFSEHGCSDVIRPPRPLHTQLLPQSHQTPLDQVDHRLSLILIFFLCCILHVLLDEFILYEA